MTNDAVTPDAVRGKNIFLRSPQAREIESDHEMVAYLSKFFCPGDVPNWGAPNGGKR